MPAWRDIDQLDGMIFTSEELLCGNGAPMGAAATGERQITVRAEQTVSLAQGGYLGDAATLRVTSATYVGPPAPIPPVFGQVRLDGLSRADVPGETPTFHIRGFTGTGLLLSATADPASNQPEMLPDVMRTGRYLILGTQGFGEGGIRFPATFGPDPAVVDLSTLCFAQGTRLSTPSGPRAVEDLTEGDAVLTATGRTRAIRWTGHLLARPPRHPRPDEVRPVRVTAHAFAPDVPAADVRLSPGHAVLVDGVLIPIGRLVNGATVVQEDAAQVRYFHVELGTHDVLLAEGLPCESYLDDGNRAAFAHPGEPIELRGRLDPRNWDDACAPMVAAGPQLIAVREQLHARAEALGWHRSEDAALHLLVDGRARAPLHVAAGRHWFAVPATGTVTLCSNAAVLAHVMPACDEWRRLGVAVTGVRIDGTDLPLDDAAFGAGFHAREGDGTDGWRWTDGAAVLALDARAPVMLEIAVSMTAPTWCRPQDATATSVA